MANVVLLCPSKAFVASMPGAGSPPGRTSGNSRAGTTSGRPSGTM
jgi:hypothetical protein